MGRGEMSKLKKLDVLNDFEKVEALVNEYLELAKNQAKIISSSIDFDEAFSIAMERLQYCAERYNPSLGASFQTYATQKIKWGFSDYFKKYRANKRTGFLQSIDDVVQGFDDVVLSDILVDENPWPDEYKCKTEEHSIIIECLGYLNERTQGIMNLYYFQGYKMIEIADKLGVTECRVHQIITEAKKKLQWEFKRITEIKL